MYLSAPVVYIPQNPVEESLREKASRFLSSYKGVRKPEVRDIFSRVAYISPRDLLVEDYLKTPVAAFNPGAVAEEGMLRIFPRLIFDYYNYTSSIGFFEVKLEEALQGRIEKPLKTRIVLWPRNLWEFRGCEDARVHREGDQYLMLYTGYGYRAGAGYEVETRAVQGLAKLDAELRVLSRKYFKIIGRGEEFVPQWMKDSAFIRIQGSEAVMLTRPSVGEVDVCWRGVADLSGPYLFEESMEPVLANEDWELKVGWSTNTVKIASNEFLVGWHGLVKEDYSYRNGMAVVSDEGELLAVSDYLLVPRGLIEEYGDRPLVIFGDGLVLHKDLVVWIGGISDYAIGLFVAELEKVMENLKWVQG